MTYRRWSRYAINRHDRDSNLLTEDVMIIRISTTRTATTEHRRVAAVPVAAKAIVAPVDRKRMPDVSGARYNETRMFWTTLEIRTAGDGRGTGDVIQWAGQNWLAVETAQWDGYWETLATVTTEAITDAA